QVANQQWQVSSHRRPEHFGINAKIAMGNDVSHADDLTPGDLRMAILHGGRDVRERLSDDEHTALDRTVDGARSPEGFEIGFPTSSTASRAASIASVIRCRVSRDMHAIRFDRRALIGT